MSARFGLSIVLAASSTVACAQSGSEQLASIIRTQPSSAITSGYHPVLLDISLNGETVQPDSLALITSDGTPLVAQSTLKKLGLTVPQLSATMHRGEAYYSIAQIPGLSHQLKTEDQALQLQASNEILPNHTINVQETQLAHLAKPSDISQRGIVLNYDWQVEKIEALPVRHYLSLEAGMYTAGGAALSTFSNVGEGHQHDQGMTRLESYWVRDDPTQLQTLRLGDAYTQINNWGYPVRFAGIQWGSNTALRPGFIPFALPDFSGAAFSSADAKIYVNNSLQSQLKIPQGNFQVTDVPVTTGSGEIRAVVKDSLGREQVYVQPYYVSPALLHAGRHEFQINLGIERQDYGIASNHYGAPITVLDHRYGVTKTTTTGLRFEGRHDQQTAGASLTQLLPIGVVASTTAAASRTAGNSGHMASIGLEHLSPRAGFSAFHQVNSKEFRQLGTDSWHPPERQRDVFRAFVSPTGADSLQFNYNRMTYEDKPVTRFAGLSYHFSTGSMLHWSIFCNRDMNETRSYSVGINLLYMMTQSRSISTSWNKAKDAPGYTSVTVQDPLPVGSGYGYRATTAQFDGTTNGSITLMAQNDMQTYEASANRYGKTDAYALSVRGGLVSLNGYLLPTRHSSSSFGVAKVGDYPNIKIMHENNLVATTNAYGVAIIPNMRPYEVNRVRFAEDDLPLNVRINNPEMEVVPRYRSGIMVDFPVKVERFAALTILSPDGNSMPSGSIIHIDGRKETFRVYLKGATYIPDASGELRGTVDYNGKPCRFSVTIPAGASPVARPAPIQCQGDTR